MSKTQTWRKKSPRLDSYEIKSTFNRSGVARLTVIGRSEYQRANLWTYTEEFELGTSPYGLSDAIHHIALVLEQDRPNTLERLRFGLNGGIGWVEEELPFPQ